MDAKRRVIIAVIWVKVIRCVAANTIIQDVTMISVKRPFAIPMHFVVMLCWTTDPQSRRRKKYTGIYADKNSYSSGY